MAQTSNPNRPTYNVYAVEGDSQSAFWSRIGAAWKHDDGDGFTITLACVPINGRLIVRKPRPHAERQGGQ